MRKFTKKLVSGIVAVSMLFTTVFSTNVLATDYTAETLEGLSFESVTAGNVKTSTWTFSPPASSDIKINADDNIAGIVITGKNSKSWNDGNGLGISKTAGMNVPVSDNVTNGTITVSVKGNKAARFLMLNGDSSRKLEYTGADTSLEFTAADVVDGHLVFTNNNEEGNADCGDYKMSKIVLVETLAADDTTTTTETSTTTTTETSTETSTDAEESTEVSTDAEESTKAEESSEVSTEIESSTEVSTNAPVVSNGSAVLTANASATEFTKVGETFTVKFDVTENTGFNNVTGFIQYNAAVVKVTDMKVLGGAVADATIVPDSSIGGYEYLPAGNTLTAAELGNIKTSLIEGYEEENPVDIVGDATIIELTFETVGAGSTAISFVPYGEFVNANNKTVDVAINNTKVKVSLEGVVPAKEGKIVLTASKAKLDKVPEEFTVDFAVTENPEFSNMTGFIEYDAKVVELVGVEDGLFVGFSTNATEVPQNTIEGYEYLDANNTLTAAQLGKVKFAYIAQSGNVPYDITNTGSLFKAKFVTVDKGTTEIKLVPAENAKDATNNEVVFDITNAPVEVTVAAPEKINLVVTPVGVEATEGVYKYALDSETNTIDVDYVITDNKSGIDNVTFFAEFDPAVLTPVKVTSGDLTVDANVDYIPSATNEDYLAYGANGVKTVAELGAIKLVSDVATTPITTETIKVVTITYEVKDLAKTTLKATPVLDADGHAVWGPAVNSLEDRCRTVVVTNADVETTGELPAGVLTYVVKAVEGATADENGNLVVAEDVNNFTVALAVKNNSGINAFTGTLDFNPEIAKIVSAKAGSDLISLEDVQAAIDYVPSAVNEDFVGLGADGVKKAGELGRLKLANYLGEGQEFATDADILVVEFEKIAGGELTIKYTDIQTSDAELVDVVTESEALVLTVQGEAAPQSKPHLLGELVHSGVIDAADAAMVLSIAKNQENASDVELDLANVDGSVDENGANVVDATDAAHVLRKAKNQEYLFSSITNGRADITVDGNSEYVNVPVDYACACETPAA